MSSNIKPNLTDLVEKKFLSLIDNEEVAAFEEKVPLQANNYIKLADLYHFHKDFEKEHEILTRYSKSQFADDGELMDVYERIDKIAKTLHRLNRVEFKAQTDEDALSIVAIESEPDIVGISSNTKVTHKHKETKAPLEEQTITVLTLCAIYTGRAEDDEVLELSLVLFQYSESDSKPFKIIKTNTGNRKTTSKVSGKKLSKLGIEVNAYKNTPIDKEIVLSMFEQADYVISHNNPDIERKKVITLFPEVQNAKWYSTQKDIPWRALGFDSVGLSYIVKSFGRRKPRTSMERAKAIFQILQHCEPHKNNLYIERIHYMKPMKALEWSNEMNRQHQRMTGSKSKGKLIFGLLVVTVILTGLVLGAVYFS